MFKSSFLLPSDSSSEDIDSVSSPVFTCGQKTVVPESQFNFDQPDPALAGNVDGIGNLATFSIPETQMQHRSVNNIYLTILILNC